MKTTLEKLMSYDQPELSMLPSVLPAQCNWVGRHAVVCYNQAACGIISAIASLQPPDVKEYIARYVDGRVELLVVDHAGFGSLFGKDIVRLLSHRTDNVQVESLRAIWNVSVRSDQ